MKIVQSSLIIKLIFIGDNVIKYKKDWDRESSPWKEFPEFGDSIVKEFHRSSECFSFDTTNYNEEGMK